MLWPDIRRFSEEVGEHPQPVSGFVVELSKNMGMQQTLYFKN